MTYIIAEIGSNHNGSMDSAREHIDAAQECGVDAVKFQAWTPESLWAGEYLEANPDLHEQAKRYTLSIEQLRELADYAEADFICSVFSRAEVDGLIDVLDYVKVASCDVTNERLLRHVAQYDKPVILSGGMADRGEVNLALALVAKRELWYLHCVSEYPPDYSSIDLSEMWRYSGVDGRGFSDHTPGFVIPLAACALGADMLEKHFTLDRNAKGWDHAISADPETMNIIVEGSWKIEQALPPADLSDKAQRKIMRRSAVAVRDLPKGHTLQEEDVIYRRPGTGTMDAVGRTLTQDVQAGQVITELD